MRILMLGAGGVGGYFGGRLHDGGADVTFLVRSKRAAILRERGLRIHGARGEWHIKAPKLLVSGEAKPEPFDVIIVSCKAYDLDDAINAIRPFVGPTSYVLPLLNGMKHLQALDAAFGAEKIFGGLAQVSSTIDANGDIKLFTDTQNIFYGARGANQQTVAEALEPILKKGGFEARMSRDIVLEMWEKFVLLTSLASMTCLMRSKIGEIAATKDGARLMRQIIADCNAVATAAGHAPRGKFLDNVKTLLTQQGSPLEASMRRDLEGGGPTEADHIVGDMLKRAEDAGIESTLLRAAYCHLQAYEARRKNRESVKS